MEKEKLTAEKAKEIVKKQREYRAKYVKEKFRSFTLWFNKESDADIIEILDKCDNKAAYIKSLIRKDANEN